MASQPSAEAIDTAVAAETDQEQAHEATTADFYPGDVREAPADSEMPQEEETPADGADGEDTADPEAELPPVAAPNSWAKDAKDEFDKLPRAAQEVIAKRETERDRFVEQKAREASQAKVQATAEARQAVIEIHRAQAEQLQQYAQRFEVQAPDLRLLASNDENHRALYFQQEAAYRDATAQRTQAQQEAEQARQQAERLEQHELQEHSARELELLQAHIPEWSEPSTRAKLQAELGTIGAELGYSPELMQQAGAADIIALKRASDWKAKAVKYDQLMKSKMVPVRAAKQVPPSARAGVPQAGIQQPAKNTAAMLYPND